MMLTTRAVTQPGHWWSGFTNCPQYGHTIKPMPITEVCTVPPDSLWDEVPRDDVEGVESEPTELTLA